MFERILVPVDVHEAEVAREAIATAAALAAAFGGVLRLVHVASPIIPASPMAVIPQSVYDEIGVFEKTELEALAGTVRLPRERVSVGVRIGGVYPEVLGEAEDWRADVIVVGAHRRSMATYLLGSTAAAISRHAKCTVTIVRSPLQATLL
jgi:nucleotide-binding universal stress UspA family protein